ncbi:ornithine decarboxylase [Dermabacter sp. p3-SID358]|uniref:ornithine decarboxylase n=1 Tax=Dermabacter sp. p3-SID358 TaxID=2916114 RepID=UPI0021A671BF|nr:ornithine decarboxylase [Dermabacter sp. p3-SID358]MCT1866803.1 ornithine decarboxylase [Dermabacter sp. p3-SID358]
MLSRTIGVSAALLGSDTTIHPIPGYELTAFKGGDLANISAIILDQDDVDAGKVAEINDYGFGIPVFAAVKSTKDTTNLEGLHGVIALDDLQGDYFARQVAAAADKFEDEVLPPFFGALTKYYNRGFSPFDCPGHQGGQFFRQHPAGRRFFDFYGEELFRTDLCNADVAMGDLLIHDGPPVQATEAAARIFNADNTWFILNGTSSSNKVAINAVVGPDDLVLFDRNNHKSNIHGGLIMAGGKPVYLETARNAFGLIGGIDEHCFEEDYIRERLEKVDPERAKAERPFRLAIIQLGTYDGTIYNARQVVDKIGHLCDYILFDSAWVGYEQWIDIMKEGSPMLLELDENDPGILVTQSVHKQQAGFSQASQIHKKDSHIKGQDRYVNFDQFNNSYMMHASTSPYYPLFASLDINAKMHENGAGEKLWDEALKNSIEARKLILGNLKLLKPFVPTTVDGKPWESYDTETIASNRKFFEFHPGEQWHGFDSYVEGQYFVDPMKLLLTTPGLINKTGGFEYEDFGIPANILANYLRTQGIVPEKCDLNSILFLLTPADTIQKYSNLVAALRRFEEAVEKDVPLQEVLPEIYAAHEDRYRGYTIRQLCQEMHDFYKNRTVAQLQKDMFREENFPKVEMTPQEANVEFIRGNVDFLPIEECKGRIAAEGALPYPPGVVVVVPGEVWGGPQYDYFMALEEGINQLPGFAPELQGVHMVTEEDGRQRAYGYVIRNK